MMLGTASVVVMTLQSVAVKEAERNVQRPGACHHVVSPFRLSSTRLFSVKPLAGRCVCPVPLGRPVVVPPSLN